MKKNILKIIWIFLLFILSWGKSSAWVWLIAENGDLLNIVKWNEMITDLNTKITQSDVTGTGNIAVTNAGSGVIISLTGSVSSSPIPDITTTIQTVIPTSTTATIHLEGDDFIPTSVVTIPGFLWTIDSVNVLSQSKIDVTVSSWTSTWVYSFVVSNNGVLNTLWAGNGVNLLQVTNNINIVWDDTLGRKYSDGSYATSCNSYKNPTAPRLYAGSIWDGQYLIKPDANPAFKVYCDMTTSGGWWTRIEYAADLPHQAQFSGGDADRWLPTNFSLVLTDTQINAIRSISSEGKQTYHGTCQWVIHYLYQTSNYAYAFGFRFHQGFETPFDQQDYSPTNITVPVDWCKANNNTLSSTDFNIVDIKVPIINVHSRDNSNTEQFGSPLTTYPAWLR